jgi:hypothetical protein
VPRIFWWLLPTWGSYSRAAAVHDFIIGCVESSDPLPIAPDRLACDRVFLEAAAVCGTPWVKRIMLYLGVRVRSRTIRSDAETARVISKYGCLSEPTQ